LQSASLFLLLETGKFSDPNYGNFAANAPPVVRRD
jgi:hypothetical protein